MFVAIGSGSMKVEDPVVERKRDDALLVGKRDEGSANMHCWMLLLVGVLLVETWVVHRLESAVGTEGE